MLVHRYISFQLQARDFTAPPPSLAFTLSHHPDYHSLRAQRTPSPFSFPAFSLNFSSLPHFTSFPAFVFPPPGPRKLTISMGAVCCRPQVRSLSPLHAFYFRIFFS